MRLRQKPATEREVRSVVILGATGSIGKSTAEIIAGAGGAFRVEAVAGGRDRGDAAWRNPTREPGLAPPPDRQGGKLGRAP